MFLADQSAEVIRIEPPPGDPFAQQTGYRVWNRGKLSVRLDLQSDEGKEQFDRLAQTSDVVVDSFSLGTTERLGIDHEALSALNPRIITCSITAYGEHNIHRDRPGYDGLVAARTGLLFDQKGRRGTAMEFIGGRPGPLPEFDAPDGLVRGADREGPIFRAPRGQASVRPTSPHSGLLRRCELVRYPGSASVSPRLSFKVYSPRRVSTGSGWRTQTLRCTGCGRLTPGQLKASMNVRTASGCITGHCVPNGSWPQPKDRSSLRESSVLDIGTTQIAYRWSQTGC